MAGWLGLMAALTVVGGGWGSLSIVPFFASQRTRRFALTFAGTLAANALVVFALKAIVARPRPWTALPDVHPLVFAGPTDFSFPSGHAAGAFCYATFVSLVVLKTQPGRRALALAALLLVLATGVALSRIALGVHYPVDVAAGALLGTIFGVLGARRYSRGVTATPSRSAPRPSSAQTARTAESSGDAGSVASQ